MKNKYNLFLSAAVSISLTIFIMVAAAAAPSGQQIHSQTYQSFSAEVNWVGIQLPVWVGWVFYFMGLIFGATLSVYQDTAVDRYIKSPKLKPYYSFGFGIFFTLFGIPLYYENITIWQLILPAVCSAAIGSQMIYYFISSAKYIRDAIFLKFGIQPPKYEEDSKND